MGIKNQKSNSNWLIFIPYCRIDREIVAPIVDLLRITGTKIFRDEDSINPGKRWKIEITESMQFAKTTVVFWCEHSAKSEAVKHEYSSAIAFGKDIVPILLDDTKLADELSEYQFIDFRPFINPHKKDTNIFAGTRSVISVAGISLASVVGRLVGFIGGAVSPTLLGSHEVLKLTNDQTINMVAALRNRILNIEH